MSTSLTSFVAACCDGHTETLKTLIKDADLEAINEGLIAASINDHVEIVKQLVATGLKIADAQNYTLSVTLNAGHITAAKYLLNLQKVSVVNTQLAFQYACSNGSLDTAKCLVELGADMSDPIAMSWTCATGKIEVLDWLFDNDISIDGNEALVLACCNGYKAVVMKLVEHGCDINFLNNAAARAAVDNQHTDVVDYLLTQPVSTRGE